MDSVLKKDTFQENLVSTRGKNMKKKNLKQLFISALLAVGFGATGVGTTFALFTDSANTAISVKAGIVKVENSMQVSAVASLNPNEEGTGIDSVTAAHYVNGGSVSIDNALSKVTISNWTPGDEVTLTTNPVNGSNVNTKMRIKVVMSGELANALVVTGSTGEQQAFALTGERTVVSGWKLYEAESGNPIDAYSLNIKFTDHDGGQILYGDDNNDNKYKNTQAEILVYYEAVQGNAATDDMLDIINTKLASKEISEGKNKTMYDALSDLSAEEKSAAETRGYLWHQDKDIFYETADPSVDVYKYFKVYEEMPVTQTYSIYAKGTNWAATVSDLKVGFDVGEVTTFTSISYDRSGESSARNIKIRTNSVTTAITLNGYVGTTDGDDVSLYGLAGEVNVIQVGGNSLHTYGKVGFIKMQKGHLIVEDHSEVKAVLMAPSANAVVVIDKTENSSLDHAHAADQVTAESNITNGGNVVVDYDNDQATTNQHPNEVVTEEELKTEGIQSICPHAHNHYVVDPDNELKHYKVCDDCGKKLTESAQHEYESEDVHECMQCGYSNQITYHVTTNGQSVEPGQTTYTLSGAIAAYNTNASSDKDYVIELEPGIYYVDVALMDSRNPKLFSDSTKLTPYIIYQNTENMGKTLTIKPSANATQTNKVIIRPSYDDIEADFNQEGCLFYAGGNSSFNTGGAIKFEGLEFDFTLTGSNVNQVGKSARLNVFGTLGYVDELSSQQRYAHDITFENCSIKSYGGKLASLMKPQAGTQPTNLNIINCTADKINTWLNGYAVDYGEAKGLTIKNCTATNILCMFNNMTAGNTITVENCTASCLYNVNNAARSTEFACIYTKGGNLIIKDSSFTILANANEGKNTARAYINSNNNDLGANVDLRIYNSDFLKGSSTLDDFPVYYFNNLNGKTISYQGVANSSASLAYTSHVDYPNA